MPMHGSGHGDAYGPLSIQAGTTHSKLAFRFAIVPYEVPYEQLA